MSDAESYLTGTSIVLLVIYFLPAIIASVRSHRQTMAIVVLNLLLGWTLIGWVVAIVWACTADTNKTKARLSPEEAGYAFRRMLLGSKKPGGSAARDPMAPMTHPAPKQH